MPHSNSGPKVFSSFLQPVFARGPNGSQRPLWDPKIQDCRLTTEDWDWRLLSVAAPSQGGAQRLLSMTALRDWPLLWGYLCIYNFITPTQYSSSFDSRKLLPIVYTGASSNHFVCSAGTSSSVKGRYATQAYVCTQLKCQTVLFDQLIGTYQLLPLRTRADLGAIAMKGYLIFPSAIGLFNIISRRLDGGILPLICSRYILQP